MPRRFPYDQSFVPGAPVVPLRISPPSGEPAVLLPALVDTGADVSLVPERLARALGLPPIDRLTIGGIGGTAGTRTVHAASVQLTSYSCLTELVAHGEEAIIGRDLLTRLVLRLDGPNAVLSVTVPRRQRSA